MKLNIFYTESNQIFLISNNYNHSLDYIDRVLKYAKKIGLTLPDRLDIRVEVLAGDRYRKMLSIEFESKTKPIEGTLLTKDSGFWDCLKY